MRNLHMLDGYRRHDREALEYYGTSGNDKAGAFFVPSPVDRALMSVVASADAGWDHVSVSRKNRTPNWREMTHVKELFFQDTETVMQLHVPAADHVNYHPHCLHLWRPHDQEIPRPPSYFVGPKPGDDRCPADVVNAALSELRSSRR